MTSGRNGGEISWPKVIKFVQFGRVCRTYTWHSELPPESEMRRSFLHIHFILFRCLINETETKPYSVLGQLLRLQWMKNDLFFGFYDGTGRFPVHRYWKIQWKAGWMQTFWGKSEILKEIGLVMGKITGESKVRAVRLDRERWRWKESVFH